MSDELHQETTMAKIEKPRRLTDYQWINLFEVDYVAANGKARSWIFASRKDEPQNDCLQARRAPN